MTKLEFIAAFTSACGNLSGELLNTALVQYERQFTDQLLSGMSEQTIVAGWGSPQSAALKLKLHTLNGSLKKPMSGEKVMRICMTGFCLLIMDLFILIPASVCAALLSLFYALAATVYLVGIFISASSLAGVNYVEVPNQYFPVGIFKHVEIGSFRIDPSPLTPEQQSPEPASTPHFISSINPGILVFEYAPAAVADAIQPATMKDKTQSLHIAANWTKNAFWCGIAVILAGMVLLVLCLLATRLAFRLLHRLALWHFNTLKNI